MDAQRHLPIPADLQARVRTLTHDLQRARLNLASGRLRPEHYAALSTVLDARLRDLEAQVQARLAEGARMGRVVGWKPPQGPGAS